MFNTFITILAGFIVLRWVGPNELGIWQALLIINTYAVFGNLGITAGLGREFPYLMGKGDEDNAYKLAATAKAYAIFCSSVTLVVLLIGLVFFYFYGKDLIFLLSFSAILIILSVQFYRDYTINLFRTNKAFKDLSKAFLIQGILSICLLPLIYYFHYFGYIGYTVLTAFSSLTILLWILPIKVKRKFELDKFKILLKTGLPLYIMAYLHGVAKSFVKFAILHFGGIILLGLFAPVFAIRNGINTLPSIISQYLYPKFSYKYGITNDSTILWKPVRNISFILLFSLSALIAPIYYFMPELLTAFFPKYLDCLFPARMALLSGVVFSSFIGVFSLNSIKGYKERLIITLSYTLLSLLLPFILPLFFNNVVEGIAWAILLTDIFYFIIAYFMTRKKLLYIKAN